MTTFIREKINPTTTLKSLKQVDVLLVLHDHLFDLTKYAEKYFELSKRIKITQLKPLALWDVMGCYKKHTLIFECKGLLLTFYKVEDSDQLFLGIRLYNEDIIKFTPVLLYWKNQMLRYNDQVIVKGKKDPLIRKQNVFKFMLIKPVSRRKSPPRPDGGYHYCQTQYREFCKELKEADLKLNSDPSESNVLSKLKSGLRFVLPPKKN